MGRGRAKAKQTKVARELKYRQHGTDLSELQRELHGDDLTAAEPAQDEAENEVSDEDDPYSPYARYLDDEAGSSRR